MPARSPKAEAVEGQSRLRPNVPAEVTSFRWWISGNVDSETLKRALNHATTASLSQEDIGGKHACAISLEEHSCISLEPSELLDWLYALLKVDTREVDTGKFPIATCSIVRMQDSAVFVYAVFRKLLFQDIGCLKLVEGITESYNALRGAAADSRSNGSELQSDSAKLQEFEGRTFSFPGRSSNGNELPIESLAVTSSVTRGRLTAPQEYSPRKQHGPAFSPTESLNRNLYKHDDLVSKTICFPQTPSREQIVSRLTGIWREVLNCQSVRETDDFFEMGGHSLLAAKLLGKVRTVFRKELSLASLLEAPTIEKQARLITEMDHPTVAKKSPGRAGQASLIFLGGDPTFQPMSKLLAKSFDFYSFGLSSSVFEESSDPTSVLALANYFVDKVLGRVPEGPYILGGWCAQGVIALEVARRLQAAGREVSFVILMQTSNPAELTAYPQWKRRISHNQLKWHLLQFEITYARYLGRKRGWDYLLGRIASQAKAFKALIGDRPEIVDAETGNAFERKFQNALDHAVNNYQPKRYEGRVILVRGRKKTFGFANKADLGWGKLLPQLEVREVDGNHFTLYMPPHVEQLVKIIEQNWTDARSSLMSAKKAGPSRLLTST